MLTAGDEARAARHVVAELGAASGAVHHLPMTVDEPAQSVGTDLETKVHAWLEASGRALELRVARAFARSGADRVYLSQHYDSPEGKVREIDVVAEYDGQLSSGSVITRAAAVECKSSKQKPWVAMYTDPDYMTDLNPHDPHALFAYPGASLLDSIGPALTNAWLGAEPFQAAVARTLVAATLGKRTAPKGGQRQDPDAGLVGQIGESRDHERNEAMDAARQALSGAVHLQAPTTGWKLGVAAVVTAAPIFDCRLNAGGGVRLTSVGDTACWATVSRNGASRTSRVTVVNESHVDRLARSLRELVRAAPLFA